MENPRYASPPHLGAIFYRFMKRNSIVIEFSNYNPKNLSTKF